MLLDFGIFILFFVFIMSTTLLIREKIRGSKFKDVVRFIVFFLPFLSPAIFYGFPKIVVGSSNGISPYLVAIVSAIIALAIQYKDYSSLLSTELYPLLPPINTKNFIGMEASIIGSAILEEIFYRTYVPQSSFLIECIVSGAFFCLAHYIQPMTRKTFTFRSYVILFLLSIAWYYSFKSSGTLLPAILGHLVYNSSSIYIIFRRYIYSRKEKKRLLKQAI